jgi:hypothetical protein
MNWCKHADPLGWSSLQSRGTSVFGWTKQTHVSASVFCQLWSDSMIQIKSETRSRRF